MADHDQCFADSQSRQQHRHRGRLHNYSNSKFNLVLGGQHVYIGRNRDIHNVGTNHDTLALAPYIGGRVDDFNNNEDLFGSLFAEVELESQSRYMRQNLDMVQASTRPVPLAVTVLLWGATRDFGARDLRRPQFLALKLANEAIMGDLLQTTHSGDNPTWNQPLRNGIQLDNAHYLQSYAFSQGRDRALISEDINRFVIQ